MNGFSPFNSFRANNKAITVAAMGKKKKKTQVKMSNYELFLFSLALKLKKL